MNSAIENVFFGQLNREEFQATEEWGKLEEKYNKIFEEFYANLTEKQKEQFNEMSDCESGQNAETSVVYYKAGFKLGLALAVEVFASK